MTFQIADGQARRRTNVHRDELTERCNFPLVQVVANELRARRRSGRSRTYKLKRRFKDNFARLMTLVDQDDLEQNAREFDDLNRFKEIFERRGITFDVYGRGALSDPRSEDDAGDAR